MNSLKALYYPITDIYSIRQYPLFLLFQNMHIITPVEKDPNQTEQESIDTFIKSGFCQVDTPCPLGENRSRFKHLLNDIKNRKDDYAAQLSNLTLASMTVQTDESERSDRAIMQQLLPGIETEPEEEEKEQGDKIWQARLVLAIGELLDIEEEDIAASLATLDDDTTSLFKDLQGDDGELEESLFDELQEIKQQLGSSNRKSMQKRLAAWEILFRQSKHKDAEIFVTPGQDGADYLITSFEKKSRNAQITFVGPALPGLVATQTEEAVAKITEFIESNKELIAEFQAFLQTLKQTETSSLEVTKTEEKLRSLCNLWDKATETLFPSEEMGRLPTKIHVFPGYTCSQLLSPELEQSEQNGLLFAVD